MADEPNAWAAGLGLTEEQEAEFAQLAAAIDLEPTEVLRAMVSRAVEMDRKLRAVGLPGIGFWTHGREAADVAADHGVAGLPLDIRPSGFMWPAGVPFPWSAEECHAAMIGYEVKWKGSFDDFSNLLRWEMGDVGRLRLSASDVSYGQYQAGVSWAASVLIEP